jgi:hypothetical protein
VNEQQFADFAAFGSCVVGQTTVIHCPIDVCPWEHTVLPVDPRWGPGALASVFGEGIMQQHAINSRNQETERELEAHLKTHSVLEWVKCVQRLKAQLNIWQRSAP